MGGGYICVCVCVTGGNKHDGNSRYCMRGGKPTTNGTHECGYITWIELTDETLYVTSISFAFALKSQKKDRDWTTFPVSRRQHNASSDPCRK